MNQLARESMDRFYTENEVDSNPRPHQSPTHIRRSASHQEVGQSTTRDHSETTGTVK